MRYSVLYLAPHVFARHAGAAIGIAEKNDVQRHSSGWGDEEFGG